MRGKERFGAKCIELKKGGEVFFVVLFYGQLLRISLCLNGVV
ncbi:hypothetical protein HPCPY1662_1586 [Helicobacter pylori CPY1662]|nr:hypothetical protein HPCPY1662_1586 [Helicobacter pylori CPY1662]